MMGELHPRPGSALRQATFSVFDQEVGSGPLSSTPLPPGPRKRGQSPACPEAATSVSSSGRQTRRFMRRLWGFFHRLTRAGVSHLMARQSINPQGEDGTMKKLCVMALGALIAVMDKRYRRVRRRVTASGPEATAGAVS